MGVAGGSRLRRSAAGRERRTELAHWTRVLAMRELDIWKAAETKLQEIRERKERCGRSLRAAALSAPIEAGEEDDLEDDGEEEREAWLATISLALCKAFDLLDMLKKEEEMLLAVKERKAKVWYDHLAVVLPLRDATLETSSGVNILFVLTSSARTYT
ncbi:PP2A regulatory subunit TAP46 [Sorghum bicolor]|uniref:PP2A regulatory subunit TAP46 n=1 Tax=Sorghum bicolor TaxID=4558 RepID=UPI000B4265FF|nr:PP2A regulatory subunit TAP46 [Sorghum bicolor]|eukprot:XP_021309223.1 PP2A regulatory subunit TAP46 [Sorghum bicolor]